MVALSSLVGGGGGGSVDCNLIIDASCLWCPAVAGTVLVHAFGGGGCARRPITDCMSAGGSAGYSQKCITVAVGDCYCAIIGAYHNPTIVCNVSGTTMCICAGAACCCTCGTASGGDINYAGCGGGGYFTMQIVGSPYSGSVTRPFGLGGAGSCGVCNGGVKGASVQITNTLSASTAGGVNAFKPDASYLRFLNWGSNVGVGGDNCGATAAEYNGNFLGGAGGHSSCNLYGTPSFGAGGTAVPSNSNSPGGQGVVLIEYLEIS